jgi:hypothetical protein
VTPPKDPLTKTESSKKINFSPKKPSARNKFHTNKPHLQTILSLDDIDLIISVVLDTSEDILQCNKETKETMYDIIEAELKGAQQALYSSRAISTMPSSSKEI